MAWPSKISGAIATTATEYGGDILDKLIDLITGVSSAEKFTIRDDAIEIVDPADTTKKVRIDAGTVSASTTRVATMPDKDITLGDTVEGLQEDVIHASGMEDADGTTLAKAEYLVEFTTTNKNPTAGYKFDTAADEYCFAEWRPPKKWKPGTAVKVKGIWTNDAGLTTETIELEVSARAFGNDDALDQAMGTAVAITDTWIAQNDEHETAYSAALTIAGTPAKGDMVLFKIMRDISADNLTGDLKLLKLIIQYTIDASRDD